MPSYVFYKKAIYPVPKINQMPLTRGYANVAQSAIVRAQLLSAYLIFRLFRYLKSSLLGGLN